MKAKKAGTAKAGTTNTGTTSTGTTSTEATIAAPSNTAPTKGKKQNTQKPKPAAGRTELVFLLDRSGSMTGLESDTIGGYNAMLKKQQEESGEATITTVLFDDKYELLHDRIALAGIRPITDKEYYVRGSTALLDAIGHTISKIANVQKHTASEQRAQKVLFVITTDGLENASREYAADGIRTMVQQQQDKYGWEFLFLGANIDAIATAEQYGIRPDRAANYHADEVGTQLNYMAVCEAISEVRQKGTLGKQWKKSIDADYARRVPK